MARVGLVWVVVGCAVLAIACDSPGRSVPPVIHATDAEAGQAMREAPVILAVKIASVSFPGDLREVPYPPGAGAPEELLVPLQLARIRADVLFTLRGPAGRTVDFYSWLWAPGSHGGRRLFRPSPDASHVVFLRRDGRHLHTVGDHPAYDLELSSLWVADLVANWKSGAERGYGWLERLVRLRLQAEVNRLTESELRERVSGIGPIPMSYVLRGLPDLIRVAGPRVVATQLDDLCMHSPSVSGQFAACMETAQIFPGRCAAYVRARDIQVPGTGRLIRGSLRYCEAAFSGVLNQLRSPDPRGSIDGWGATPADRREAMRMLASAVDADVRSAACHAAAMMAETRDIPECLGR